MSTSIDSITVSSVLDKRLVLANSQAARVLTIGNTWSRIRLGIRIAIDDLGTSILGNPKLYLGMLSNPSVGLTNGPLTDLTSHFVGTYTPGDTWTRQTGPPIHYNGIDYTNFAVKKVNAAFTVASNGTATMGMVAVPNTTRNIIIVEITKGSPNFTIKPCYPNNSATADMSDPNWLIAAMEIGTFSSISTYLNTKTGTGSYSSVLSAAVAVDEGVNGPLNAVCVAWDRQTPAVHISDFYWAKMA
jgi:hypothetical protein